MKSILAEVVTIGDEILYGQITDTNTQWMSAELSKIGIRTVRKSSVGDTEDQILQILKEAESRADVILITGGLGPTKDDITKKTLAKYFGVGMVLNEEALANVTEIFARRGFELTELNRQQAMVPTNCTCIVNKAGTAPGMWFEHQGKIFVSMPGVPYEMKWIMENWVLEHLSAFFQTPAIYHKNIRTIGIGESFLAEQIEAWEDALPSHIRLAYLPSMGQVKLRLTATGASISELEAEVQQQVNTLLTIIPEYVYGYDDDELETVIGKLLLDQNLTLATAESCTGGYVAHTITKVPGSSRYFTGGMVTYSNDMKINQLDVLPDTLVQYGAVSEETVRQMAENVRKKLNTDIGISTSGIAGPDGGTPDKPVGTIWIAYADKDKTVTKKLQLFRDRLLNIQYTTLSVLNLLRQNLPASVETAAP
ncbi:competence/damage-inducible protein A [Xanthocytophaga flava]|uniref:competence/damage-inducible protein A n=1 Tax=Xanthocytophaga flava TaxID=3048013 RepID=UPI0028D6AB62|nr:competence/damage-inducible protein A [Xanthocytophaga flavus]MDJ1471430.1 competence/damage-inducible protein A [Xanthocytophaga flavus]